jgi:hypothetical protein
MSTADDLYILAGKAREVVKQVMRERPPRSASKEEKAAWFARYSEAQALYAAAEAATGYGPGVSTR